MGNAIVLRPPRPSGRPRSIIGAARPPVRYQGSYKETDYVRHPTKRRLVRHRMRPRRAAAKADFRARCLDRRTLDAVLRFLERGQLSIGAVASADSENRQVATVTSCHFDNGESPSDKDINSARPCSEVAVDALRFCNGGKRSAGGHACCSADRRGTLSLTRRARNQKPAHVPK
jgi:hypothetical protein